MCGSTKVNSEYAHLHSTYLCRRTYDRGALSVDGYIAMQMVTTLHTHGAYACDLRGQPNAPTRTRFCPPTLNQLGTPSQASSEAPKQVSW